MSNAQRAVIGLGLCQLLAREFARLKLVKYRDVGCTSRRVSAFLYRPCEQPVACQAVVRHDAAAHASSRS